MTPHIYTTAGREHSSKIQFNALKMTPMSNICEIKRKEKETRTISQYRGMNMREEVYVIIKILYMSAHVTISDACALLLQNNY